MPSKAMSTWPDVPYIPVKKNHILAGLLLILVEFLYMQHLVFS